MSMKYLVLRRFWSYGKLLEKGTVVDESEIRSPHLRRSEGKITPAVPSQQVPVELGSEETGSQVFNGNFDKAAKEAAEALEAARLKEIEEAEKKAADEAKIQEAAEEACKALEAAEEAKTAEETKEDEISEETKEDENSEETKEDENSEEPGGVAAKPNLLKFNKE